MGYSILILDSVICATSKRIIDSKIVLIDGQELAQLMIDNHVGVSTVSIYEIKKIDSDYFTDE
jgi:restriction system protein